jgi:hypothetical protein
MLVGVAEDLLLHQVVQAVEVQEHLRLLAQARQELRV